MSTSLRFTLTLAAMLGAAACDPGPEQPGTTTDMSGGDGTTNATTDDGTGDGVTGEPQGCAPPNHGDFALCDSDEDCAIAGDCCGCIAYTPANTSPGNCGGSCGMDKCEEWGITEAVCQAGHCAASGLSCNQALVICDVEPPACDAGFLPRVWGGCFAGDCLPVEACDWAPDCETCGDGQLCMHETRSGCDYVRCVNDIAECQGEAACCTGESYCGNDSCVATADGFSCE